MTFGFPVAAGEEAVQDEEEQRDQVEVERPLGSTQGIIACIHIHWALAPDHTACHTITRIAHIVEELPNYIAVPVPVVEGCVEVSLVIEESRYVAGDITISISSSERNRVAYMILVESLFTPH